jgi:DNA helicase HerA-like ATPase
MSFTEITDLAECIDHRPIKGLLISPTEIWFTYSVEAVKLLREGLIVGVRNTSSVHLNQVSQHEEDQHYSLLRIEAVEARHFIIDEIRQDRSDAPVSVEGLLDKYQQEWRRRSSDPEENNLRIVASVSTTGQEIHLPLGATSMVGFDMKVQSESGTPMLGEVAFLMTRDIVQMVVNRRMSAPSAENAVMVAGSHTLYRKPPLEVLIDAEPMYRRHFGIFGFTGAGKSNLLSTLVSKSLNTGKDSEREGDVNVVLFDVNNEFYSLLIDSLMVHDSHVIFLDDEISQSMSAFLEGNYELIDDATDDFLRTTTRSSAVERLYRTQEGHVRTRELTKLLLASGCFKKFEQQAQHLSLDMILSEISSEAEKLKRGFTGAGREKKKKAWDAVTAMFNDLFEDTNRTVTVQDFGLIVAVLTASLEYCESEEDGIENPVSEVLNELIPRSSKEKIHADLVRPLRSLLNAVIELSRSIESPIRSSGHTIDLSGIYGALHDDKRTLIILLGSENTLRTFADALGSMIYDIRRRNGVVDPATTFIFDEADVFIPQNAGSAASDEEKEAIGLSKKIATKLARRGRKYGLGLGIATQRIAYLDTSILAQIGTYFVGRLPRLSDRQRITEGFGIDKDSLQVGIHEVGDWVVLSHTAVGDAGSPLPVHFDNADDRIVSFIKSFDASHFLSRSEQAKMFDYHSDLRENSDSLSGPVSEMSFLP